MPRETKSAHVLTFSGGVVNCCTQHQPLDYWSTGTIRTSGSGLGTCNPGSRHFDIIRANTSGIVSGCRINIEYENSGTSAVKPVTRITVSPPAMAAHAMSVNFGMMSFSSEFTIAPSWPTSLRHAQWHSWVPKLSFNATLVLFNSFPLSISTGGTPERLETEADETDGEHPVPTPAPPNGGYGVAPSPGAA
jgi:hypothetical protein